MESSSNCFEAACKRLGRKSYLSHELQQKLLDLGFAEGDVEQTITRLITCGYINDAAWVDSFIRGQERKCVGRSLIIQKLKLKKVAPELYVERLQEMSVTPEESISALLSTRYKNKNLKDPKEKQRVIASLLRRGFTFHDIKKALLSR